MRRLHTSSRAWRLRPYEATPEPKGLHWENPRYLAPTAGASRWPTVVAVLSIMRGRNFDIETYNPWSMSKKNKGRDSLARSLLRTPKVCKQKLAHHPGQLLVAENGTASNSSSSITSGDYSGVQNFCRSPNLPNPRTLHILPTKTPCRIFRALYRIGHQPPSNPRLKACVWTWRSIKCEQQTEPPGNFFSQAIVLQGLV